MDLSLAAWLSAALPPRTEIDFGPPARRAAERTTRHPAINVFLHAVDEDTTGLRASEIRLRDENGRASGIMLPIRRYALTYLLTAWAGDPVDEHRLLGTVLLAHAGHDHLAGEHLRGALAEAGECLPVHIGRAGHDVRWDRLGLPGHNGLVLTVLAPVQTDKTKESFAEIQRELKLPVGQDGAFAAPLAARHKTAGGVTRAIGEAITAQIELAARTHPHPAGRDIAPPDGDELSPRWRRTTRTEP